MISRDVTSDRSVNSGKLGNSADLGTRNYSSKSFNSFPPWNFQNPKSGIWVTNLSLVVTRDKSTEWTFRDFGVGPQIKVQFGSSYIYIVHYTCDFRQILPKNSVVPP